MGGCLHRPMNLALPLIPTGAYGMRPYAVMNNSCFVGVDSISARSNVWQYKTARANMVPPPASLVATCTHQKAGANISFAPAVLLLRSHSLITLFVIFRTVSASSWESSYLYANFVCPFKTLTNCSLDLPSGSLFAQKHLWNGVMFVIKIVLGVMGLMPRTKAS